MKTYDHLYLEREQLHWKVINENFTTLFTGTYQQCLRWLHSHLLANL